MSEANDEKKEIKQFHIILNDHQSKERLCYKLPEHENEQLIYNNPKKKKDQWKYLEMKPHL